MKSIRIIYSALMLLLPFTVSAISPSDALKKAKDKIGACKSLSADFKMTTGGKTSSGQLKTKGNKFYISTSYSSNWYDGANLYTYNPGNSETTIFRPTAEELQAINPMLYLNASANFNVVGSKQSNKGEETVVLLPKNNKTGVKNVTIRLNSTTFLPKSIEVTPSSGAKITIQISKLTLNPNISDSQFVYPSSKYPKVKINDMR